VLARPVAAHHPTSSRDDVGGPLHRSGRAILRRSPTSRCRLYEINGWYRRCGEVVENARNYRHRGASWRGCHGRERGPGGLVLDDFQAAIIGVFRIMWFGDLGTSEADNSG